MATDSEELVQKGLHFAIVDEVDSVLIDDARTPLIISGPVENSNEQAYNALKPRIQKLYEASNAGVEIKLIIRGICCIVPGVKGYSENIKAISIVDRFLEHARVFIFHHGGEEKIYLSSADWMVRNLSHRLETAFPILQEDVKKEILDHIDIQWADNVKARIVDNGFDNKYSKGENDLLNRSQIETYFYIKRKMEQLK